MTFALSAIFILGIIAGTWFIVSKVHGWKLDEKERQLAEALRLNHDLSRRVAEINATKNAEVPANRLPKAGVRGVEPVRTGETKNTLPSASLGA